MKNKLVLKVIFLLFIFFLTGCSVEYNIDIKEDNSLIEKVVATEKTKRMEAMTRQKGDQAVSYLYDMFKRNDDAVNIYTKTSDSNTIVTVTKVHNDLESYTEEFKSDVFEKISTYKSDNVVTIIAEQSQNLSDESARSLVYDNITFNITVPYTVVENNADKVLNNTYTWYINKNSDLKTIKLSYKEGSIDNKVNLTINNSTYNINYWVIVGIIFVVVILIIVSLVYIKNKKNNVV